MATVSHFIRHASSGRVIFFSGSLIHDGVELPPDDSLLGIFLIDESKAFGRLCLEFCHVKIQIRHISVNRKKITRPEEASRMGCDTVAIKRKEKKVNPEDQNYSINLLFDDTRIIDNIHRYCVNKILSIYLQAECHSNVPVYLSRESRKKYDLNTYKLQRYEIISRLMPD